MKSVVKSGEVSDIFPIQNENKVHRDR